MSPYRRMMVVAFLPIFMLSVNGCGHGRDGNKRAGPPIKKKTETRLTEDEVIKIAEAAARSERFNLHDYNTTGCHYEFTGPDRTWNVVFEPKNARQLGGDFVVRVDARTRLAKLIRGQ